jgi:hypothetical protein
MALSRLASFAPRFAAFALLACAAAATQSQGRFTTSADGQEVTDGTTHLTWRRCAVGTSWDGKACSGKLAKFSYAAAKQASASTAKSESKAWRLPTRDELFGLVDMKQKKPRIDPQAFPKTPALPFWATRPGSDDDLNAWLVNFSTGKVHGNAGQAKFPLRLVRAAS